MMRHVMSFVVALTLPFVANAEDLAAILNYVPKEANALMVIDLKGLMATPMAAKEGWKKRVAEETTIGVLPFPETAEYAVVAEQLQPGSLQGKWELVLISTSKPFSFPDIAKAEKAEIEAIGRTPACFTKRNTVIVQLSSTLLGVFGPGHRQDVARWLKGQTGKPTLQPMLAKASDMIKAGNQVALVFDLEDTLEASKVKPFIASHKEVQEKKLDVEALSKTFSSLAGVSFVIKVGDSVHATMKMEFTEDLGKYASIMNGLVLTAFDRIGADVEEYQKGTVTASAKTIEIQAALTPAGFKSTMSMVQPHSIAGPVAKKSNKPDEDDPGKEAQKSFKAIQNIANSAHDQAEKSNDIARAMVIYDNAATRLDKLPMTNVETEIQQFGADVSRSLREIASALHTGVLEVQTLETKIRTNVNVTETPARGFGINPWGFSFWNPMLPQVPQYNVQTNLPDVVAAQQEAINKAVRKRNEIWKQLVEKSATLKKAMSTKYGVPF